MKIQRHSLACVIYKHNYLLFPHEAYIYISLYKINLLSFLSFSILLWFYLSFSLWLVLLLGKKAACPSVAVNISSKIEARPSWDPNTVISEIGYIPEWFRYLLQQKQDFLICTSLCVRAYRQWKLWLRVFAFMLNWKRISQYQNYPIFQTLKIWFY